MKLTEDSLEFAKKHIDGYCDSDFFPFPFEYKAIWAKWDELKEYLLNREINELQQPHSIIRAAPKHSGGFRIVHQLDPLHSIVYTSLASMVAAEIEKKRIPEAENIACSYRIQMDDKGSFFKKGSGYEAFRLKTLELASNNSYALVTDITDFYNQIYVHRVRNSIEGCNPAFRDIAHVIETYLLTLNNNVSKGIPVGPNASIIFSEAILIDVDEFISSRGFAFVRYVDDIRIFSNSRVGLRQLLEDLSHYLYSNHRLSLSSQKTRIMPSDEFVRTDLNDPEELEKQRIHAGLEAVNLKLGANTPYFEPLNWQTLPANDKIKIQGDTLRGIFKEIVGRQHLDLGLSRHILRRAGQLRTRSIYQDVLSNFDFLAPVVRDTIIYMHRVTTADSIDHFKGAIRDMLIASDTPRLKYVGYWLRNLFSSREAFFKIDDVQNFMRTGDDIRHRAAHALTNKHLSWVREHKDNATTYGHWDRRAVIFASQLLTSDERRAWLSTIENNATCIIDRILARHTKSI